MKENNEERVGCMDKKYNEESLKVAGKHHQTKDYQGNDQTSTGLAITHEQVSDAYIEGEINAVLDNERTEIPHKGYESE